MDTHTDNLEPEADDNSSEEDSTDPSLPRTYSALLLFLHALASKPSFVHLDLSHSDLASFVLDHMPVWPYLLSLDVHNNPSLRGYRFELAAEYFPSLTSLTSSNCSDAAIANIVRLPAVEELRFPWYLCADDAEGALTSRSIWLPHAWKSDQAACYILLAARKSRRRG